MGKQQVAATDNTHSYFEQQTNSTTFGDFQFLSETKFVYCLGVTTAVTPQLQLLIKAVLLGLAKSDLVTKGIILFSCVTRINPKGEEKLTFS